MRIKLTENQLKKCIILEFADSLRGEQDNYNPIADGNAEHNPYTKQINASQEIIKKFLFNNGKIMTNIDNGKDYIIYEIGQLASLIGKRFCICQLYKENKPFGSILLKPYLLFKEKIQ